MWQAQHLAPRPGEVRLEVPRESATQHRRSADRELQASVSGRGSIQIEKNEASRVTASDVVDDLIRGRAAIDRCVEPETIVQKPELGAVLAVGRRLVLERRAVRIRPRVLADSRISCSQLTGHEPPDSRKRVGENEA